MKNYEYYLGVDVSKKTLDVCVLKGKDKLFYMRVSNDDQGIKGLSSELKKRRIPAKKILVCLENTGFYGYKISCWAAENSYGVWLENAIAIKRSLGLVRGKNDKVDAYRIALYALRFEDKCRLWLPPRKAIQALQQLLATRARLLNTSKRLKTPLKESALIWSKSAQKEIENCCKAALVGIEKSIKEVEKKIDKLIKRDTKLSHMTKIITSIDGVGPQIAAAFIVATKEFQDVNQSRKLACYAGVVPFEHTSGTSVRGKSRVSHLANKSLKSLLHMVALSAKPKMVAINAIRNKLVSRICVCVRQNRMYEKNHIKKVA